MTPEISVARMTSKNQMLRMMSLRDFHLLFAGAQDIQWKPGSTGSPSTGGINLSESPKFLEDQGSDPL
jgi:hypothetical protein